MGLVRPKLYIALYIAQSIKKLFAYYQTVKMLRMFQMF
jgi:hypothetical protein